MADILVVDDDASIRDVLSDILVLEGYDVRTAADGFAALREIREKRPDCLVLDLMRPGMDGHQVLTEIRTADGGTRLPVVMLTATADGEESWRAMAEGVDYFLGKPFDAEELLRFIEYLSRAEPRRAA
jgi:DNA-binding response OmpR family regulator